jgi:hypothetical protein
LDQADIYHPARKTRFSIIELKRRFMICIRPEKFNISLQAAIIAIISYNEPRKMREELIKMGIPPGAIYLDFAVSGPWIR